MRFQYFSHKFPKQRLKGFGLAEAWYTDSQVAQRCLLRDLEVGDEFRALDAHGKPHGPRYVITRAYDYDYGREIFPYMYTHNTEFEIKGKAHKGKWHFGHKEMTVVKPIGGVAMLVEAKLKSSPSLNLLD